MRKSLFIGLPKAELVSAERVDNLLHSSLQGLPKGIGRIELGVHLAQEYFELTYRPHTAGKDFGERTTRHAQKLAARCLLSKQAMSSKVISAETLAVVLLAASTLRGPAASESIPADALRQDFQIARRALEQAHGGIYRYTPKAEMDRIFDRAYRNIQRPMTDLEFWRLLAPVVARIKCGHTFLLLPEKLREELVTSLPLFPLEMRVLDRRAYVFQDYANTGSPLEGNELLSINGVPSSRILEQLRALFTGDGNTEVKDWRISHLNGFTVCLYGLGIEHPFRVTYRTPDRRRRATQLAGLTLPDREKAWTARNPPTPAANADSKFLDDGKIAVMTIRHWYEYADEARQLSLSEFFARAFAQMKEKGAAALIIDVRDNDGGLDAPGKELFSYFWDKPFYYDNDFVVNGLEFDFFKYDPEAIPVRADIVERRADGKFHLIKHPNVGLQQPKEPHFSGKLFALMNGGSFSTSCEFLSMLHFYKRATFIGQEAAGGYYGCTAGRFVHLPLPSSKLDLRFGLTTYYQAVSGYPRDRGVIPDHPVTYTIAELLAGKDKEMDLALSLARGKGARPRQR
jgi:hypothetical protein